MAKFCGKCGSKLNETTGMCPNCDTGKQDNITKKDQKASLSFAKKIRKVVLKFIFIIVLLMGSISLLVYFDIINIPIAEDLFSKIGLGELQNSNEHQEEDFVIPDEYKVDSTDADEYFEENSRILSEIDINDSKNVLTEAETIKTLAERGFEEYPVITEYVMDGSYNEATVISEASSTKHPIYQTNYINKNNEIWAILIIEDTVIANPVSYNMQSNSGIQVIISETDMITSYDSNTNKFYKTIPDETVLIVKVVGKVDAETLENLTIGAIDEL